MSEIAELIKNSATMAKEINNEIPLPPIPDKSVLPEGKKCGVEKFGVTISQMEQWMKCPPTFNIVITEPKDDILVYFGLLMMFVGTLALGRFLSAIL